MILSENYSILLKRIPILIEMAHNIGIDKGRHIQTAIDYDMIQKIIIQNASKDVDDIVKIKNDGFSINLENMKQMKMYYMTYLDSKYVFYKNSSDELVIKETL